MSSTSRTDIISGDVTVVDEIGLQHGFRPIVVVDAGATVIPGRTRPRCSTSRSTTRT